MSKREEALEIIKSLGLPRQQQNERSCLTLLALAGLKARDSWAKTTRPLLRTVDIMQRMSDHYGKTYKPNSRETIRRQTLHQFVDARLIDRNPDKPDRPTNSGDNAYQLTEQAAAVLRSCGRAKFSAACEAFIKNHGTLSAAYDRARNMVKVPITLPNGSKVELSPGVHNELQKSIVEDFSQRFAPGSLLLYLGDTADKRLVVDSKTLKALKVPDLNHDKLPDVVLFDRKRNWLFLIEAVTSHGPVSPKRHAELEAMLANCDAGRVYVTAFMDFTSFKKYAADIVWESEVWIAEFPDHMIHFNGDKFMGPYPRRESNGN